MPNFEQVAFFIQFIITLFPNWLIEPLMPFLAVTGINVCLNKAECWEVGFFSPLKNAMSMQSAAYSLQISYFSQQRFVTMWHAVHFLIAYQDYLEDILLQLGVSNHLPQKIQNALSATWWNTADLFRRSLESWQKLSASWRGRGVVMRHRNENLTPQKKCKACWRQSGRKHNRCPY